MPDRVPWSCHTHSVIARCRCSVGHESGCLCMCRLAFCSLWFAGEPLSRFVNRPCDIDMHLYLLCVPRTVCFQCGRGAGGRWPFGLMIARIPLGVVWPDWSRERRARRLSGCRTGEREAAQRRQPFPASPWTSAVGRGGVTLNEARFAGGHCKPCTQSACHFLLGVGAPARVRRNLTDVWCVPWRYRPAELADVQHPGRLTYRVGMPSRLAALISQVGHPREVPREAGDSSMCARLRPRRFYPHGCRARRSCSHCDGVVCSCSTDVTCT